MGDRTKVEERGGHPESSLGGGRPGSGRTSCTVDYVGWRPLALGGWEVVGLMEWELEKTGDVKVRATGKTGNLFHDWIFFFFHIIGKKHIRSVWLDEITWL